jgi:hypothetical protein
MIFSQKTLKAIKKNAWKLSWYDDLIKIIRKNRIF